METPKKLIQELSDLTRNLDVLAKEIRDSNKINSESQKTLSKNLEISAKKKSETSDKSSAEANQNKNFLENLGKTIKDSLPDIGKIAGKREESGKGKITRDLVSAVVGKFPNIPKMASGGKVSRPGVALVGENGPEVVELQKGDSVNPLDKMSQLMKMEDEDSKSKKTQSGKRSAEIVSGSPKLGEFVTNSFGVKVPADEIASFKSKTSRDYADEIAQDPDFLGEEVKSFIEGYRETVSVSDVQKLSVPVKPKEDKGIENTGGELQKSKRDKSSNKKSNLQKSLMDFGEKIKVGSSASIGENSPKKSFKDAAKEEFGKTRLGSTINYISTLAKKKQDASVAESGMKNETTILKDQSKAKPEAAKPQAEVKREAEAKKETLPAAVQSPGSKKEENKSSAPVSAGSSSSDKGKEAPISSQDIQDIKGLLAAINTTLSGPLAIKNNKPFRPTSKMLE
jgi:hypothetical protein